MLVVFKFLCCSKTGFAFLFEGKYDYMVFSSVTFLFAFLPCTFLGYYVLFRKNRKLQNRFMLVCSLLFYAWGGIKPLFLMLFSIFINWLFALLIDKSEKVVFKRSILGISVFINVSVLFVFKYLGFTVRNINSLFNSEITVPEIALPIGISFFTFQAMSYVIDVYRAGKGSALTNPLDVGLYISLFPQLIAGPIVRYDTVKEQILHREETYEKFYYGIERFIIGLGKKSLLANSLAIIAETSFSANQRSSLLAWLGIIAYTLQIYFDFSGYSDMAIGLGKMFGFEFLENFEHPYLSKNITEFWRRWHISMGTWFRDYVYFPLGGSRVSKKSRVYFNLFVVWLLTGIWHGANWTFVFWGLLQLIVLVIEKSSNLIKKENKNLFENVFGHIYTMLVVMTGWVFFNSDSLGSGFKYLGSMFGIGSVSPTPDEITLIKENILLLIVSVICCLPIYNFAEKNFKDKKLYKFIKALGLFLIFALSVVYIVKGSYNPFIYFNF